MSDRLDRLAAKVVELRAERRWSQQDLATATGLTKDTIWRVENAVDRRTPQRRTILKLAAAFGVEPQDLFAASRRLTIDEDNALAALLDLVERVPGGASISLHLHDNGDASAAAFGLDECRDIVRGYPGADIEFGESTAPLREALIRAGKRASELTR